MAKTKSLVRNPLAGYLWTDTAPTAAFAAITGATSGLLIQVDIDNTADTSDAYLKFRFHPVASGAPIVGTDQTDMVFKCPSGKRILYTIPVGINFLWIEPSISSQLYYSVTTGHTTSSTASTTGTLPTVRITIET